MTGKGTVEIDTVQPLKTLRREVARLGGGVGVEDGGVCHHAFLQAHADAVLQVDGGKDDHGRQLRKFSSSLMPMAWLFSGWNWVPAIFSLPTMAVSVPP